MSPRPGLVSPWAVMALMLVALLGVGIQLGVMADILSPAVWIDVVSLWPLGAVGLIVAPVVWLVGGRRPRHLAIAGLTVFSWLALGLALHVSGAQGMPVSESMVVGPAPGDIVTASLSIDLDAGTVELGSGSSSLYRLNPIRAGGTVGAPTVYEQVDETDMTVVAVPRVDPGSYVFRGWTVDLDADVTWSLDVAAPSMAVDLRDLKTGAVKLRSEASEVLLGPVTEAASIDLVGDHRVVVPEGLPVRLRGEGVVPDDWVLLDEGGARAPTDGVGWVIVVESGSRVEIWYR